ncbi:MAG: metal ABC transporter permease [Chlamydiota bacterium]
MTFLWDPLYSSSILGSCLLCFCAGVMGVILFLRKRSLLSEILAHAAYPGFALGGIAAAFLERDLWVCSLCGAVVTALLGCWSLSFFEKRARSPDAAMSVVMSGFFAWGLLLASYLQNSNGALFLEVQKCFFGEVTTILDEHVLVYASLALSVILFCYLFYRKLQLHLFDPQYSKTMHLYDWKVEALGAFLLILAVVMGIRSCGLILVSAMLIAPAAAARLFASSLAAFFVLAGAFALLAGFIGNVLAIKVVLWNDQGAFFLPPGPLIVLTAGILVIGAHLFAPKGLLVKRLRILSFRARTLQENLLKELYDPERTGGLVASGSWPLQHILKPYFLRHMRREGLISTEKGNMFLTEEGKKKALKIIRLHRLWEVYLTERMGVSANLVHPSAEEMEHILTPDLEKRLDQLLKQPQRDPHNQPIPERFS